MKTDTTKCDLKIPTEYLPSALHESGDFFIYLSLGRLANEWRNVNFENSGDFLCFFVFAKY